MNGKVIARNLESIKEWLKQMTNIDKKDLKLKKYLETCTGRNIVLNKQKTKTKNLLFMGSFFLGKTI